MSATPNHKTPQPTDGKTATAVFPSRAWYLPDRGYWKRAVRRQWLFFTLVLACLLPLASLITWLDKPVYRARVTAFYDERMLIDHTHHPDQGFPKVAANFERQFASEEFLFRLWSLDPNEASKNILANRLISGFERIRRWLKTPDLSLHERQSWLAQKLRRQIHTTTDTASRTLTIITKEDHPESALRLAQNAMEIFIADHLSYEAEVATTRLEALRSLYEREVTRTHESSNSKDQQEPPSSPPGSESHQTQEEQLRREEQEIDLRLQRLKATVAAEISAHNARRAALDSELARLGAQLTPSHPDYIAKQEELRQLPRSPDISSLNTELAELIQQQARLRADLRRLGLQPINPDSQVQPNHFVSRIEDELRLAEVETSDLREQIANPSKRTRLKALGPTSIELERGKNRSKLALAAISACLIIALFASILREIFQSLADDPWHLSRRNRLPIVCEISKRLLRRHARMSRIDIIDLRRAAVRSPEKLTLQHRRLASALVEFRYAARAVGLGLDDAMRPTLLLPAGIEDKTADAFVTLFNVYADEHFGKTLVIDLSNRDPLAGPTDELPAVADLAQFLAGKAPWRDVRLEPTELRAAALVPPLQATTIAEGTTRLIRAETLRQLYTSLAKGYQHIFVRGMTADQPLVNQELIAAAGDIFVVCDGRNTTYKQVQRAICAVPCEKMRGLILIGSID